MALISFLMSIWFSYILNDNLNCFSLFPLWLLCVPAVIIYIVFVVQDLSKSIKYKNGVLEVYWRSELVRTIVVKEIDFEESFISAMTFSDYWFLPWSKLYNTHIVLQNKESFHISSVLVNIKDLEKMKIYLKERHTALPS